MVRGTVRNGVVVPDDPSELPEGERVLVRAEEEVIGIPEEDPGDDPESIARWLAWYDSVEPLIVTAEDEERIAAAREQQKAFELATRAAETEKLRKLSE